MTRRPPASTRFHAASLAIIAASCLLAYSNGLDGDFVLDDWDNIVHNPYDRWTELDVETVIGSILGPRVRRPVAHVSFGLNHYFGGYDVSGYHLVNILVHLVNAALVYLLATLIFRRWVGLPGAGSSPSPTPAPVGWMALLAALLFVTHPLQTQSVSYVVQRMNSLATGFYLAALLLWVWSVGRQHRRLWRAGAVVCGLLALGSKEIAITLPFAIALTQGWFVEDFGRDWRRRGLLVLAPLAVAGLLAGWILASGEGYEGRDFDPLERLLTQARVVVFYLSLIVWPLPSRLNLLHDIDPSRTLLDPPATLACVLLLAALFVLALVGARRHRLLSFAVLWFLLHLAVESTVLPLRMIFEHRTYLPLVGVVLLASHALFTLLSARPRIAAAVAALVVACLTGATHARVEIWRDSRLLWADAAAKSPRDPLARMQMGSVLARAGRLEEALIALDESIRLDSRSARPHNLKGAILLGLDRLPEALEAHREAARLDVLDATSRSGAAEILLRLGRHDEAVGMLEDAIRLRPDETYVVRLAEIRERQGRREQALELYLRAVQMNGRAARARVGAGILLADRGRLDEAIEQFGQALRIDADAEVHAHLGVALWQAGRPREAIRQLDASVRRRPDWLVGVNNLSWMLATCPEAELRDPDRSIRLAEDALRRQGGTDVGLLDTLAAGYAAAGRFGDAAPTAARAARLAQTGGHTELARQIGGRAASYRAGRSYVEDLGAPRPESKDRRG